MVINNAENHEKNSIFSLNEYDNKIDNFDFNWTLLSLYTEDNPTREWKENSEYNKYPYISEQDYKKYFAPETYNFRQFNIWTCRFVASIYWITQMKSYKQYVKNSVKKDENWNFIVKIPLSDNKETKGTWHKIDVSVYQNQRRINWENPQILENNNKDIESGKGIVALAMAIWEEMLWMSHFDIHRLEGWDAVEIFLDWKTISDISLEKDVDKKDIEIDELKGVLKQDDTLVIAHVKSDNYWSFESAWNNDKSNHEITILKIIKDNDGEYIQYYDPNFSKQKMMSVDDFKEKCFWYEIFCKTNEKHNYYVQKRKKQYNNDNKNRNSAWIIVESTKKPNETLRELRWDFITYNDGDKLIVESRGKRAEIVDNNWIREKIDGKVKVNFVWNENISAWEVVLWEPYRSIYFSDTNVWLNIDRNKLSNKHKWEKNDEYDENLYLPKIANFMNRMIYNYIDTESRNKNNPSPFSINKLWDLVLDDDPYSVKLDKIKNSERENIKKEWEERKKEKEKPWNHKLVCLRYRSELGIRDKETKQSIVNALNEMVMEKKGRYLMTN